MYLNGSLAGTVFSDTNGDINYPVSLLAGVNEVRENRRLITLENELCRVDMIPRNTLRYCALRSL